jgi:phage gp29-like protein
MILPEGYELEFLNPSGSPEVFKNLIDYIDKEIALVLCGENEAGMAEAGSRASSQVANTVRVIRASELSEALSKTLTQTLIRWIVDLNFGTDVASPYLTREFRIEESPLTMPDVALLIQSGYTPRKEWIERHFRVELQQKDVEAAPAQPPGTEEEPAPEESPEESTEELSDEDLLKSIFGDDYEVPEGEEPEESESETAPDGTEVEEEPAKKPFGKEKITEDEAVAESKKK